MMEVKRFGPSIHVAEGLITECYKDGLPEAESILRMAREEGNEILILFMQGIVDDMKRWIEDYPEVI